MLPSPPYTATSPSRPSPSSPPALPFEYQLALFVQHLHNPHPSWGIIPHTPKSSTLSQGAQNKTKKSLTNTSTTSSSFTSDLSPLSSSSSEVGEEKNRTPSSFSEVGEQKKPKSSLSFSPSSALEDTKRNASSSSSSSLFPSYPSPLPLWQGVTLDGTGAPMDLHWGDAALRGNLSWPHLPRSVCTVKAWNNALTGGVGDIPPAHPVLQVVDLRQNALTGGVGLRELPGSLKRLALRRNRLVGACDLEFLPLAMRLLDLGENGLEGGIYLHLLPPTMKFLYLDNNGLGATLHLTGLPPSLKYLYLNHNRFMGRPDLSRLPTNLELHLEHNYLSGVVFTTTLHPGVLINPQKGGEVVLPEKKTRSCVVS